MKKTILSTVIATALTGSAFGALAISNQLSGHSVEQRNAIEASFDKKNILANAIQADSDSVRVIVQLTDVPMAQFSAVNPSVSSMAAHKGQKVNFKSNAAKEYQSFLEAQQQSVIQSIKSFDKSFKADMSYTAAFIEAQGGFPAPSQLTVNVTATHVTQGGETNAGKFIGLNAGVLRYGIEYAPDGAVYLHLFKDGALVRDNMSRDKSILLKADGQSLKLMLVGESYPNLDFNGGYNGQDVPNPGSKSITMPK